MADAGGAAARTADLELAGAMLRHAPVPFAVLDTELRYLIVNDAQAALHAVSVERHLGHRPTEILPADLAAHIEAAAADVLASGRPQRIGEPVPAPGAAGRSFAASWYPVHDPDGRLIGVAAMLSETTDLLRSNRALRASGDRAQRLLESTTRLAPALRVEQVLATMTEIGRDALGADYTGIGVVNNGRIRLPVPLGANRPDPWIEVAPSEQTLVALALRDGKPIYVEDGTRYLELVTSAATRQLLAEIDERSWALVPLRTTGAPFGVLRLAFRTERVLAAGERLFLEALAGQCAMAVERAQLYERERDAVVLLQRSLLPTEVPPTPGLEVACRYLPGRAESAVGGDWYDVFALPDGRFALVVGDVMGNGLEAASCMGRARGALRAFALGDPDPVAVFTGLDRLFQAAEEPEMLTTCVYGVIDAAEGTMATGNAGHLPLFVSRVDGSVEMVVADPPGTPLGWAEPRVPGPWLRLSPGDVLVAFTDGLVESRDRALDVGLAAVAEALREAQGRSAEEVCDRVQAALLAGRPRDDDVTLLVARLQPGAP
ncbi:MAG TPA: SpoIIE family protein phosphatase [Sporichthyaceae bacterium]|nr:SpoIIE family protein phosphatase [Sporichthyaceae bacterium]